MTVIFSLPGVVSLALIVVFFAYFVRGNPLGALSLPGLTFITMIVYFYVMPLLFLSTGNSQFFGIYLTSLADAHVVVMLYAVGCAAAFQLCRRILAQSPIAPTENERPFNMKILLLCAGVAAAALAARVVLGQVTLTGDEDSTAADVTNVNFLNLGYSILIPVVLVAVTRSRFSAWALAILAVVTMVFLTEGFRFRIVILLSAAAIIYAVQHRFTIRTLYVAVASLGVIAVLNAIGAARQYGRGLDLTRIDNQGFTDLFQNVGGEIGPVFVLIHLSETPPPHIYLDPVVNVFARVIPSLFWPDKPYPTYLYLYADGFPDPNAQTAGIAGTQQAEFLLQFGLWGTPILSFLFFSAACFVLSRILRLGYEGRLVGCAIMPALVGFFCQQRGYLFQNVSEIVFTLAPLFLIYLGTGSDARREAAG